MGKITGLENIGDVPPKVLQMYEAVLELFEEGADATSIRVSTITDRAGIGKGTAYEYFDTKEDILACAVAYHIRRLFSWLETVLLEKDSFREQLDYLLDEMGSQSRRKFCFLRFVHLMTDNSEFSNLVRRKLCAEEARKYTPMAVFGNVLGRAVKRGELRSDLSVNYMVYLVFSHLMTYMMAVTTGVNFDIDMEKMRIYVYQGILGELCEKNK